MMDLIANRRRRLLAVFVALALGLCSFAIAFACGAYESGAENLLERPGGMILFAFLGCWLLIFVAKLVLTPLLQREENYYREGGDDGHV